MGELFKVDRDFIKKIQNKLISLKMDYRVSIICDSCKGFLGFASSGSSNGTMLCSACAKQITGIWKELKTNDHP